MVATLDVVVILRYAYLADYLASAYAIAEAEDENVGIPTSWTEQH
jgi:hypothetical protein